MSGDFHGFWKDASGKCKGDELIEAVCPIRMEAGKDVECESLIAKFGRNILDGFNHIWEVCREGGGVGGGVGGEIEGPCRFSFISGSLEGGDKMA